MRTFVFSLSFLFAAAVGCGDPQQGPNPAGSDGGQQDAALNDITSAPETDGGVLDSGPAAKDSPLHLALTIHLEGWGLSNEAQFDQYVKKIREYSDLSHKYGAYFTWEAANLIQPSVDYGDNILLELQSERKDGVGVHADLGGNADKKGLSQAEFQAEMQDQKTAMLGVKVRHVSGICSSLDWVDAAAQVGYEGVTGIVEYCLKALDEGNLPAGYEHIATCTGPADCHDTYPSDAKQKLQPWLASTGSDWVTHDPTGKVALLSTNGTLPCLAEIAANPGGSQTKCTWAQDDVDQGIKLLDFAIENRDPKLMNQMIFVWSFGQAIDPVLLEQLLSKIKTDYVDKGLVVWKTMPQLIDTYRQWK